MCARLDGSVNCMDRRTPTIPKMYSEKGQNGMKGAGHTIPYDHYVCIYRDWAGRIQYSVSDSMKLRYPEIIDSRAAHKFTDIIKSNVVNGEGVIKAGKRGAPCEANSENNDAKRFKQDGTQYDQFSSAHFDHQLHIESDAGSDDSEEWVPLAIGDDAAVEAYFVRALNCLQQQNCRYIAKAIIKVIEPRKQVVHPYNGGKDLNGVPTKNPEYSKPPWWPAGVKHKEPDHLMKSDRVRLLLHILRMKEFRVRPKDRINADELRNAVNEVRRTKITGEEHRQVLDEMLDVVEFQERYWRDEVGPDARIFVRTCSASSSKKGKKSASSSDDDEEDDYQLNGEGHLVSPGHMGTAPSGGSDIMSPMHCNPNASYTLTVSSSDGYPVSTMSSFTSPPSVQSNFTNPFGPTTPEPLPISRQSSQMHAASPLSSNDHAMSPMAVPPHNPNHLAPLPSQSRQTVQFLPRNDFGAVSSQAQPRTIPAHVPFNDGGASAWSSRPGPMSSLYASQSPWPSQAQSLPHHSMPPQSSHSVAVDHIGFHSMDNMNHHHHQSMLGGRGDEGMEYGSHPMRSMSHSNIPGIHNDYGHAIKADLV